MESFPKNAWLYENRQTIEVDEYAVRQDASVWSKAAAYCSENRLTCTLTPAAASCMAGNEYTPRDFAQNETRCGFNDHGFLVRERYDKGEWTTKGPYVPGK